MMRWLARFSESLFRRALRWMVPSLDEEDRREALQTFRELGLEARDRGLLAYLAFVLREARSLGALAVQERRGDEGPSGSGTLRGRGFLAWLVDTLAQDTRYAARNLARSPGFVTISVLSLTFGIAVSTGLFSVVNAALFRPLPHAQEPERLVRIFSGYQGSYAGPLSYPDFQDIRENIQTLEGVALFRDRNLILGAASEPTRQVWGMAVSENYFDVVGIRLARGRGFLPEDIAAGGEVAVIGYQLWEERFGRDPGILGQTLRVNGHSYTVVGVGPDGMTGINGPAMAEVIVPAMEAREERGHWSGSGIGRMKPGVTIRQVQAELDALSAHLREEYPDYWDGGGRGVLGLGAKGLRSAMLPEGPGVFLVVTAFLSVVGLILLIACSNVANLLLTRALNRRGEVAIRSAIGASGGRILGQLLTENLLLFGFAGALSLLLTYGLASVASTGGAAFLPPGRVNVGVDLRVVLFALGLALAMGLTFGLLPALQASRPNLVPALKGRGAPPKFRLLGLRNLLVGAQVGGSLVLVLVSLLLTQSLSHAGKLDLGFEPRGVVVMELNMTHGDYQEAEGRQFLSELTERVERLPGVTATALADVIPLQGGGTYLGGLEPEGYEPAPGERVSPGMNVVTPGYFDLTGIRLLTGRDFSEEDRAGSEPSIVVNQAFVNRYWPGESGVGKLIRSGERVPYRVVGIAEDISSQLPGEEPGAMIWLPFSQFYVPDMILHVRTTGDPRGLFQPLRDQVEDLNPQLPIVRMDRMEAVTANATLAHRILSVALGIAGVIAMALAMLGIYGVVSFSVSQRTREVGLRVALGAEATQVIGMVVREGLGLALIGLIPGILLSLAVAQLMRAALMGLSPLDPLAFGGSVGLLLLSVMAAALIPARRAARADPMEALRED